MTRILILLAIAGLVLSARTFVGNGAEESRVATTTLAFGFVLLTSYFAGRAVERFGIPKVTGYLAIGLIMGPHVLDLVTHSMVDALRMVDGVAIALIALTAGGELNLRKMKPLFRTIRSMVFWGVLGTALVCTGVVYALRPLLPFLAELNDVQALAISGVLGIVLASQSPAVVQALLNETHSEGPLSRTMLAMVVISDLVVIALFAIASSSANALLGAGVDVVGTALLVAWDLFGSIGVGVAVGGVLSLYLRKVGHGNALFVLLVCLVVEEVGRRVHLDPLLVMLAAGVFLENVTEVEADKLIHEIEGASLPVYVIFFAVAGAALNLPVLLGVIVPAAILVVARGIAFWVGCGFAAWRTDAPKEVGKYTWIGLLPQAGLALALALLFERSLPSVGAEAGALVLGVVGINQLLTPILLRWALVRSGEAGQKETVEFGEGDVEPAE